MLCRNLAKVSYFCAKLGTLANAVSINDFLGINEVDLYVCRRDAEVFTYFFQKYNSLAIMPIAEASVNGFIRTEA